MSASRKSHENGCRPMWNFKLRLPKVRMRVPLAATRVGPVVSMRWVEKAGKTLTSAPVSMRK